MQNTWFRRRHTTILAVLALTGILLGCGKNRVLIDVDVTSFISEQELSSTYSTGGLVPPDSMTVDSPVIEVVLMEGSQDFVDAEELSIDVGIEYDTQSGDGDASFTVFFADSPQAVFNTAPVTTVPAVLVSGGVTNATATFEADQRIIDLFTQERAYMGLRFNYRPASNVALQGVYTITNLMAHVVSTIEIF
jgi:hypothetical protein